jgi:hypothetical protein
MHSSLLSKIRTTRRITPMMRAYYQKKVPRARTLYQSKKTFRRCLTQLTIQTMNLIGVESTLVDRAQRPCPVVLTSRQYKIYHRNYVSKLFYLFDLSMLTPDAKSGSNKSLCTTSTAKSLCRGPELRRDNQAKTSTKGSTEQV